MRTGFGVRTDCTRDEKNPVVGSRLERHRQGLGAEDLRRAREGRCFKKSWNFEEIVRGQWSSHTSQPLMISTRRPRPPVAALVTPLPLGP